MSEVLRPVTFRGHDYVIVKPDCFVPELDFAILQMVKEKIASKASDRSLNALEVSAYGHPHGLAYSASYTSQSNYVS
jgi:hypothetical protein